MRVIVTGGTGFIGSRLLPCLLEAGHEVRVITRDAERAATRLPSGVEAVEADLYDVESLLEALDGAEGVIHLAGHNLFEGRWSKQRMQLIRDSRVVSTRALVEAMGAREVPPRVFLSGSAIGFYGPRPGDEVCLEDEYDATNFAPRDFLAGVCREWEGAARKAELLGTRTVRLRTGVVLGRGGGATAAMETPFKLFVGGKVGSGKQVMSWIHLEDAARMIAWALDHEDVHGALNVVAPEPVTNQEFARAFGRALGRPALVPTPGPALRVVLGKVAQVLTQGQRVLPKKALDHGFTFRYATLDGALAAVYAQEEAAASA